MSSSAEPQTRPATTTFFGDTGLWFVPTAEVLAHGKWSVSGYRRGTNYIQGFTNVGDFAGTFAVGIKDRVEVFGSFLFDTRIDRDLRPLFINDSAVGGIVDRYPRVNQGWTGDNVGDLYRRRQGQSDVGVPSEAGRARRPRHGQGADRQGRRRASAPARPTSSSTSSPARKSGGCVELSGYGGYEFRGQPDGFDTPSGAFRWGGGAGFPSRSPLRGVARIERRGAVSG